MRFGKIDVKPFGKHSSGSGAIDSVLCQNPRTSWLVLRLKCWPSTESIVIQVSVFIKSSDRTHE